MSLKEIERLAAIVEDQKTQIAFLMKSVSIVARTSSAIPEGIPITTNRGTEYQW